MHWILQEPALWWGFTLLLNHLSSIQKGVEWVWKLAKGHFTRSFTITSSNSQFHIYQTALGRLVPEATSLREVDTPVQGSSWRSEERFDVELVPDHGKYRVKWEGVWLEISSHETEAPPKVGVPSKSNPTLKFTFLTQDKGVIDKFRGFALSLDKDKRRNSTTIWTNRWNGWVPYSQRSPRPSETLFYPDNVPARMLADLRTWQGGAESYRAKGQVHKRGYLLQGPPGNGKTTLIMWLASQMGMGVALLSCRVGDENFLSLVSALPQHTILILEDVDALFESVKTRKGPEAPPSEGVVVVSPDSPNPEGKVAVVSLSLLLNFLDGLLSRDGQVVVLTTNFPEKLDSALIRKGRADQTYTLRNSDVDLFAQMYRYFYGIEAPTAILDAFNALDKKPSMADLEGFLKDTPVEDAEKLLDRARTVAAAVSEE